MRRQSAQDQLLRYELSVDDAHRAALGAAAELLWDDLLDSVSAGAPEEAELLALLPPTFIARAQQDWRRWLATFTAVTWKLGQPVPGQPATMAEQICVGVLARYARTEFLRLVENGVIDLDVPPGGVDYGAWLDVYLDDADHELLYDPAMDGIDDASTGHQYGFGRMDYEGMFVVFNELNDRWHGLPHPLASSRLDDTEADAEQGLQAAAVELATRMATAIAEGRTGVAAPKAAVDVNRAAHRASHLLHMSLVVSGGGAVRLAGEPGPDETELAQSWLESRQE